MRLGLIARDEIARGLAIQSKGIYDHIKFDKVLLVRMPKPDCDLGKDWYPNATVVRCDRRTYSIDETVARQWLRGLDVVFTVETPYHWHFPRRCREAGVKMVIQGNPEFYKHGQKDCEDREEPDEWWWPTSWRPVERIPAGRFMPVPMPNDTPRLVAPPDNTDPLRVLHVIGKRAHGDRNGSDVVANAMRFVDRRVHLTMYGLDGQLPDIPHHPYVTVESYPHGVADRWSMYGNQHLMVLPRRYGGLCLSALEAKACGLPVLMPDVSPNRELATDLMVVPTLVPMQLPCGRVMVAKPRPHDVARFINGFDPASAVEPFVARWDGWRQKYLDAFAEVANG